jgi:hypothetical protein
MHDERAHVFHQILILHHDFSKMEVQMNPNIDLQNLNVPLAVNTGRVPVNIGDDGKRMLLQQMQSWCSYLLVGTRPLRCET